MGWGVTLQNWTIMMTMMMNTLSFDVHVDNVCKFSYFHLRALRHIRNHISEDTAKAIACSMIHERLDYCNSVRTARPLRI